MGASKQGNSKNKVTQEKWRKSGGNTKIYLKNHNVETAGKITTKF